MKTRQCSRCHGTGKHGPVTRSEGRCFQCVGAGRVPYSGEKKKRQTSAEFYASALQNAIRYRDNLRDADLIENQNIQIAKLEVMLSAALID